jgi:hypothetical protein
VRAVDRLHRAGAHRQQLALPVTPIDLEPLECRVAALDRARDHDRAAFALHAQCLQARRCVVATRRLQEERHHRDDDEHLESGDQHWT